MADTGRLYTVNAVSVPSGMSGAHPWVNPENAEGAEDSVDSTCTAGGNAVEHDHLYCYHGGAGIGESAQIDGILIEARIRGSAAANHPNWVLGVVINGSQVGIEAVDSWPTSYSVISMGGPTNLLGISGLTGADVNLINSGAILYAAVNPKSDYLVGVDWVAVTYYYHSEEDPGEDGVRNHLTVLGVS